jgi:hypothetical protein
MLGFRHTGAMCKGCSGLGVRQSSEASASRTIRIVEVGFYPVFSLPSTHLEILTFTKYHYEEYQDSTKQYFVYIVY